MPARVAPSLLRSFVLVIAGALAAAPAARADVDLLAQRTLSPTARQVQEIRLANDLSSRTALRLVVLTNGPNAGTTTLTTAAIEANALFTTTAQPSWDAVIPASAVFSVGAGCRRGDQLDFPFIQNFRPKVLRFRPNGRSIVDALGTDAFQYDSAECVTSKNGDATYFMFTDRSNARLVFVRDAGGATDLNNPWVSFSTVKTPFTGGLRPSVSRVKDGEAIATDANAVFALQYMRTNGQTRWLQYDFAGFNVEYDCLVGTQTPPPTTFTIPRGSAVSGRLSMADPDGNGFVDVTWMNPGVSPNCLAPTTTTAGTVAGASVNWSEFHATHMPQGGHVAFGNQGAFAPPVTVFVNPLGTRGGPHAGVAAKSSENSDLLIGAALTGDVATFALALLDVAFDELPEEDCGDDRVFRASNEDLFTVAGVVRY